MRALVFRWGAYTEEDLIHYFKIMNINTSIVIYELADKNHDDAFEELLKKKIENGQFDFVFSVNYFPVIAEVCYKTGIRYISWSYDAPLNVINIEETLGLPTNTVYMFDRLQAKEYQDKGINTVFYLPLAVPVERYDAMSLSDKEKAKYGSGISFVGNMYTDILGSYISPLSEYDKGYISAICNAQSNLYGAYIIDENISDELIKRINDKYREIKPDTEIEMSREALSYAMAAFVTRRERISILGVLANRSELKYYSRNKCEMLENAIFCNSVDYVSEMPKVFKASTVNLNITLKILRSGIPLRALDIMGCGGFLLSNYQPELAEYFTDGVDMVMYSSVEDAISKSMYYARNKEKAECIAINGYEKVKKHFNYIDRINTIVDKIK